MTWTAIAYNLGKRVKPIWDSSILNFMPSNTDLLVPESDEPILVMDMGGIIRRSAKYECISINHPMYRASANMDCR